jgi:hypothetical protein
VVVPRSPAEAGDRAIVTLAFAVGATLSNMSASATRIGDITVRTEALLGGATKTRRLACAGETTLAVEPRTVALPRWTASMD